MTATSWVLLTDMESDYFDKREGVMLSAYDDKFCMVGGIDEVNKAHKDIYFSIDGGVSWTLSDTLTVMPVDYKARGFASVQVKRILMRTSWIRSGVVVSTDWVSTSNKVRGGQYNFRRNLALEKRCSNITA